MIYKARLEDPVDHITVTIVPQWFFITRTSTHILLICSTLFLFFLKLVYNARVVVVKIGVKLKIFSIIKKLCTPSFLLGYRPQIQKIAPTQMGISDTEFSGIRLLTDIWMDFFIFKKKPEEINVAKFGKKRSINV